MRWTSGNTVKRGRRVAGEAGQGQEQEQEQEHCPCSCSCLLLWLSGKQRPHLRSVHKDPGGFRLAHDFGHFHLSGGEAEGCQLLYIQGWAVRAAHGRQLRGIADEEEFAAGCGEHVLEEVGEQVSVAEGAVSPTPADHTGLVHYEECAFIFVGTHGHSSEAILIGIYAIDAPVDGAGRSLGVGAEHLGRAACGGH
jgi:hypothetical protein